MRAVLTYILLLSSLIVTSQNNQITGFIYDKNSGEALIGANIYCPQTKQTITTDRNGHFYLYLKTSNNKVTLQTSYIGYIPAEVSTDTTRIPLKIFLLPTTVALHEVTVSTTNKLGKTERLCISPLQIKNMHSLTGESDVLRALQTLPGVQMGSEVTSGIHVRGGSLDQNLFILDGIPLYQVNHLGGFVSTFEANTIRKVELLKGAFPAMYGGRLSSVVDVRLKDGNQNLHENELMIGTLNSKFFSEGKLNRNMTYMLSFRVGNPGWMIGLRNLLAQDSYEHISTGFFFFDLNGKLTRRFSERDKLSMTFYTGKDNLYSKSKTEKSKYTETSSSKSVISWGNTLTSLSWNHFYTSDLSSEISLAYTQFVNQNSGEFENASSFNNSLYKTQINDLILRTDFNKHISNNAQLSFGNEAILHHFNPGSVTISQITEMQSKDTAFFNSKINSCELSPYLEGTFKPTEALTIRPGFRLSSWLSSGRCYLNPEPRVSFSYNISDHLSVESSCTWMTQYVHMITNNSTNIPNDIWIPSTRKIMPEKSFQTSIGMNWEPTPDLTLSVDAYRKRIDHLTEYTTASPSVIYTDWESLITTGGIGKIDGLEFQLEKKSGNLNGWFNYTLSKNTRQFETLNDGNPFPYVYDNRHVINIVCNYLQSAKTTYTFSWTYKSGNHITLPIGKRYSENEFQEIYIYNGINNFTTRPYHRLDIGMNYKRSRKTTWHLGVYNAYNSMNPFYYYLSSTRTYSGETVLKLKYYVLLPFLPSISYAHKF